jgi:uncharacterized membrane protein YfcA
MTIELIILASIAYLIAGTIKGTVGIGLPTASIGILSQFTDPRFAISLVVFPILFSNAYQVLREGQIIRTLKSYYPFAIALMIVLMGMTFVTASIDTDALIVLLGSVMVLFSLSSFISDPPALPDHLDKPVQIFAGICSGLIGGLTAIWSPPMIIYLLSRRVDKTEFIRATGLLIFLGGISLALGFWQAGHLSPELSMLSIGMIIPTLIGFTFGEWIRRRMDASRFRSIVLMIFLLMGLNLIRKVMVDL